MPGFHYLIKVPNCPFCQSTKTGRLISTSQPESEYARIEYSYMQKGEYVAIKRPWHQEYNVFCYACKNLWYSDLKGEWVSAKEKEEYIQSKNIEEDRAKVEAQKQKEEEKRQKLIEEEYNRKHKIIRKINGVVGKSVKSVAKNMIFDPTIGTLQDFASMIAPEQKKSKEETAVQKETLTFKTLADELALNEEEATALHNMELAETTEDFNVEETDNINSNITNSSASNTDILVDEDFFD